MARIPPRLSSTLLDFQRNGIQTLLRWGGRGLLADEMGLGKTIQGIATLGALRPWPALLIVPASLRLMWAEELETWLPELIAPGDIRMIGVPASPRSSAHTSPRHCDHCTSRLPPSSPRGIVDTAVAAMSLPR